MFISFLVRPFPMEYTHFFRSRPFFASCVRPSHLCLIVAAIQYDVEYANRRIIMDFVINEYFAFTHFH